jgi:hypothetical protein
MAVVSGEGYAQSLDLPPVENSRISVEVMRPNLEGNNDITALSSVWHLGFQTTFGSGRFAFISEASLVILDFEDYQTFFGPVEYDGQLMIGNPLVAIEFRPSGNVLGGFAWIGIRPPLVEIEDFGDFDAASFGIFTDFDQFETFTPERLMILGGGGWRSELAQSGSGSFQIDVGISGSGLIATDNSYSSELFAKGHLQFRYLATKFSMYGGYSAVAWVSSDNLSFSELMESQVSFGIRGNFGNASPGMYIRFPVEEEQSDLISYVIGLNLIYNFPRVEQ